MMPAGDAGAAQADVQRHHRPLREADQQQLGFGQSVAGELGVEEGFSTGAAVRTPFDPRDPR